MKRKRKKKTKLEQPIAEVAQNWADRFIAGYGIADAECVALLVYEKIVASRKSLERKYGSEK